MATALVPLANLTMGSAAASVTFSSISQSYRDLMLVINATPSSAGDRPMIQLNGDTSSANYSYVYMTGTGSAASSSSGTDVGMYIHITGYMFDTTNSGVGIAQLLDYSATDKHKTMLARGNNAGNTSTAVANRWANTAAVTSIKCFNSAGQNFGAGSTFALYGIASA